MTKISIIDSIMGSGKTNWAIQYMNENPHKKFIYVSPYNDELKLRIIPSCPKLNFRFAREGHKVEDFKDMLIKGQNIVATHECFKRADEEVEALLDANNYILILDEVFDVVIDIKLAKCDVDNILTNYATVDNNCLVWIKEDYQEKGARFSDIMQMAKLGKLMVFDGSFFLWLFPVEIFKKFSEVYIMTFLFAGQIQKYYFDLNNVQYQYYRVLEPSLGQYQIEPHDFTLQHNLKGKIDIYDGPLNDIGNKDFSLSKTWFDKSQNKPKLKALKNNIRNFFRDIHNAKSNEIIWTCFKGHIDKLKGDGYAKGFVECNCRATNKYGDRTHIAYCINRYMRTVLKSYFISCFKSKGMDCKLDEDLFALAEMLQLLWRSAIRNDKRIDVYIPSKRMRNLVIDFLEGKIQVNYSTGSKCFSGQI